MKTAEVVQSALTGLLWILLACSIVPVAARAAMYLPIMLLFGFDDPHQSVIGYLAFLAIPPGTVLAMVALGAVALRAWGRDRWRYASFPIAFGLLVAAALIWVNTEPR